MSSFGDKKEILKTLCDSVRKSLKGLIKLKKKNQLYLEIINSEFEGKKVEIK